jgi:hypothetical protein
MAIMMTMNERAAARQADHNQRERQFPLELERREDEREERRAIRESHQMKMKMMMMARIFGSKMSTSKPNTG